VIVTVASFKGGVGKTTTAVHVAAYLGRQSPTLLVDGDPNRSATGWTQRGELPIPVIDENQLDRHIRDYAHIVIDTEARPSKDDLATLAKACDLLVIPTTPDTLALDALGQTIETLRAIGADNYAVLLTIVPPKPNRDGEEARELLRKLKISLFKTSIARLIAYQKSARDGVPVYAVSDRRAEIAWGDYVELGKEIVKRGKEK
jgi:chromosome partitioning protein